MNHGIGLDFIHRMALRQALIALAAWSIGLLPLCAQQSVCTVVKIELGQQAALEREAFNAHLVLTNNQADAPLSSLSVIISIKDSNGNPADALFFNKVTDLTGVSAVDGSGTMQPASQADIRWLIIPSPGAGGTSSAGAVYAVTAQISYVAGGVPSVNATQPAAITVFPQPLLNLEYVLPFEVFGLDPFTLTGTTVPFPLGLRVTNVGAGAANNFQITAAQPTITDNKQGLPISFQILGTFVGSNPLAVNSLTIPFGNIPAGGSSLAAWDMTSSFSGRFIDFSVTFTHAAELGGALTSLIQSATTYTLMKDVLDDTPGHDAQFDLLVNTSTPRSQMEVGYQLGLEPQPDAIMESDRPGFTPVRNVAANVTGTLSGANGVVSFAFDPSAPANAWVHASIPFPQGATVSLISAVRSDGKALNPRNAWIAKHIDKLTNARTYFLHLLDYTGVQPLAYGMTFNAATLDLPPDPISNLSVSAAGAGALALSWNATGEDGSTGTIIGGKYAIFASTDLTATPSVSAAAIVFSTNTPALAAQGYLLSGLLGNATYQIAVFLADAAGRFSKASNAAVAQTLANAPAVSLTTQTATGFALSWTTAANAAGTLYRLQVSSAPGQAVADTGFVADLSSASFAGLAVNQSYQVTAFEKNSAGALSPAVVVATVTTTALPPAATSPAFVSITTGSAAAQWLLGGNPADTEFFAELSTSPSRAPVFAASGWVRATGFTFTGLTPATTYYARVKARNRVLVETAFADLGAVKTAPVDTLPPRTTLIVGAPSFGAASVFISSATSLSLFAVDDKLAVGDGIGVGVAQTFLSIDSAPFAAVSGTFTLVAEGTRTLSYYSVDLVGNTEASRSAAVAVDRTPPVTQLAVSSPSFQTPAGLVVSSQAVFGLSAVDPLSNGVASGVKDVFVAAATTTFSLYGGTFTLSGADGAKIIQFFSRDNVLNAEVVRSTTVLLDDTPPMTALAALGGRQFPGPDASSFYASSDTRFTLLGVDPAVNGVAAGVAFTQFQDNGGAFQVFTSSLSLPEGRHLLGYQSQDNVRNLEVLKSATVLVDATPPVTAAHIAAPLFAAPDGTNYITPATPVTFTAVDPALPQLAGATATTGSGVNRIEVAVDTNVFVAYASTLTFAEGRHAILYRAVDNVGNMEAARTLLVQSDNTPPVTTFQASGSYFTAQAPEGPRNFAPAPFTYALPTVDPVVDNVASGVDFTRLRTGQVTNLASGSPQFAPGPFQNFSSTFSLAEGIRRVEFQSQDHVGNLELLKSATVFVDATPPVTSLAVLGGHQFPAGAGPNPLAFYASLDTRYALPAADPVVQEVASGLAFTRFTDNGGSFQRFVSTVGFTEGAHLLGYQSQDNVGNLEALKSATILADATPPVTTVTIGAPQFIAPDGAIYVSTYAPVTFTAADPPLPRLAGDPGAFPGSGVNRIEVAVDGGPFTTYAAALTFAEGRHAILYRAVDNVGNIEAARTLNVQSDGTPPISSLVIGSPQFQLSNILLVSSRTPFSITAIDPIVNSVASGVKDTFFPVSDVSPSTAAFAAFTAPFTMAGADVNKVVEFFSRDNVLNTEVVKSSAVLLDSTPPEVSLLSPAACDSGICRVLKGKFPVLGTARDLHFAGYQLEFAPGQNAGSGFVLIASGTVAVSSGVLGAWDASALSGFQTLRLTAADLVQNVSTLQINVFVGDPGELMTLGNHEVFNMPEGVAVGQDGKIYVADRNNDRIAMFSSSGTLLASFGRPRDEREDRRDRDDGKPGTLRLNKPAGVAVDGAGNLYVADTNDDRVLKLSATGQILLELGRRKIEREDDRALSRGSAASEGRWGAAGRIEVEFKPGRGPGEFNKPSGVAVDPSGSIYVSDTENRRVQVFSSTGAFTLQFLLPPVAREKEEADKGEKAGKDEKSGKDNDEGIGNLGKPVGIALDGSGNIYVADPQGRRALKFDPAGRLLLTLPVDGIEAQRRGSGEDGKKGDDHDAPRLVAGRPVGIAVSPSGNCLLVSDRKLSRILKFDMLGKQNLAFGDKGKLKDDDDKPRPVGIVFNKPFGLALDSSGNLFVADRNNDRIRKFSLPTGRPTLVVPPPKPDDDQIARDVVDKDEGGTVARKDKAAVEVPAQALADDLKISVSTPVLAGSADESNRRKASADKTLKPASPPVEYGPEGTVFTAPVTLTLPYNAQLAAAQGVSEDDLQVHYWNRDKARWEDLPSVVDKKSRTVSAKSTHFSLYQVFSATASALAPLAPADPTFTFRDLYVFPNPAVGGAQPTIHLAVGVADQVTIQIFDISGRQAHQTSLTNAPAVIDDGKGPQYAYEYAWTGHIPSGVYLYTIKAEKSGFGPIRKSGKFAVVR